jgi:RHS repeat-associated protein
MLASSQLDLCIGLDIHMEMVPVPPAPLPVPTPFPMPFVGMIEFSPGGLLLSVGIAGAMSAAFSTPPSGPVLVNGMQATKTGDEAQNKKTMPHMVIPPGIAWTPLPKPLKLKMKPGPPPAPDSPAKPPGDAVMVTGSKTVYFEQSNACRLGTLAMSCSDPVRLPSSMLLAIPKGLPVLIGGPPTFDWATAAKAFFLRNKWTAGLLNQLVGLLKPGRLRNLLGWAACQLTGHPVDVATGRLLTRATDFELRGPIPLTFERFYSSAWAERDSSLGFGWSHTFDERIWVERGKVVYKAGDGRELEFHTYDLRDRKMHAGEELFYPIDRLKLKCLGGGQWEICTPDGLIREFALLPGHSQVSYLTKIRNRLRQWVAFEYDNARLLDTVRTSEGRWVRLEHFGGRLKRVAVPYPSGDLAGWYDQVSFTYSAQGDLVAATDTARRARTYRYENHLLVQETDRDGLPFYFEYDGRDSTASCVRTWGNDGKGCDRLFFRELTYDRKNRHTVVENSLGHTTTYEMNVANGVVKIIDAHAGATTRELDEHLHTTAETNPLGAVTRFEYDARGNETKRVLANGASFTMAYNEDDQIIGFEDPFGVHRAWTYDSKNRLVSCWSTAGESLVLEYEGLYAHRLTRSDGETILFERDEFGQRTKTTYPDGTLEEHWYDRQGRLVKLRDAAGRATRLTYDLEGRGVERTLHGGPTSTFAYSPEGDLLSEQHPLRLKTYGYAGFHRLAWQEQAGERLECRYDSENDLVAVINEDGEEYTYTRDACGRIETETTFEGRRRTYARDGLGNVVMTFLPDRQMVQTEHDVMSSVTCIRYPDGEERFTYDLLGNLETATNGTGTLTFERNAERRVVAERFGEEWIASKYDRLGRVIEVASSKGLAQRMTRSTMGDVRAVGVWDHDAAGAHAIFGLAFQRDAVGAEVCRTMAGGIEARSTWDEAGRPSTQTITRGGDLLDSTDYEWAGLDRLVRRTDAFAGPTEYAHDDRGRLSAARCADGRTTWRAPSRTGNLFRREDRSDRRYGKGGVLLEDGGTSYSYDADGNVVEKRLADDRVWKYGWSRAGALASVVTPDDRTISFAYDALGRRISKTVDGKTTRWLWNGNAPAHEWTTEGASGDEVTTWVFVPGSFAPLGKITSDDKSYGIVTDYLGTPREMFDEAGKLAWKAQLDIYGVSNVSDGDATDCPWRMAGQYEDAETGLYYNRFRYYDPHRGDYISQDPIGLLGGAHLYGYARDPLNENDPLGLSVVIGEGQKRVDAMAKALGAETITTQNFYGKLGAIITGGKLTPSQEATSIAQNRQWMREQIADGQTIVDIGRHPDRVAAGEPMSRWYQAELEEIAAAKANGQEVTHVPTKPRSECSK